MVESGGATAADFRDVFKNNIDKRIKNLPEIDGLRKGFEKSIRGFFWFTMPLNWFLTLKLYRVRYAVDSKKILLKMISNKPDSSKDTVLSSWMGKFDAIYFGEDENNLGTGHF